MKTEAKQDEPWIKDFQGGLGEIVKSNIQEGSSGEPLYLYKKKRCVYVCQITRSWIPLEVDFTSLVKTKKMSNQSNHIY